MNLINPELPPSGKRHLLLYILHSSEMYGTERMALATSAGLADEYDSIFIGPPGQAMEEARKLGFQTREFRTSRDLARVLRPILAEHEALTVVATGPRYSLVCITLNMWFRRRINHIQIIHGGAGEQKDYARKKVLNNVRVTFVAVSQYVRERLIAHGVRSDRIEVVFNFLPDSHIRATPKRALFTGPVKNIVVASRLVPLKHVDLILDALDLRSDLNGLQIKVLGDGDDLKFLRERARRDHPNVELTGFTENVSAEMAKADLLVHTCPIEPFGLVILEAMAADIPVLVPNTGGAATLVEDGVSGFHFQAENPEHLGRRLAELHAADPSVLNRAVAGGRAALAGQFSAASSLARYRALFRPPA